MRDRWAMRQAKRASSDPGNELQQLASAIGHLGGFVEGLRERVRLLEAVLENFPGGICVFDADLDMVLCNGRLRQMLDYPDTLFSAGYPSMEELFRFNARRGEYGPGDPEEQVSQRMRRARQRKAHVFERTRPNGTVVEVRGSPVSGGGFVTTYFDVTEQRRAQSMIAHMAHHDALTNLPNRTLFTDRLQTAIALAKRNGLMAVHSIDIDGFKTINDSLGHSTGDKLLIAAAERLSGAIRENDTLARLGGDEFAIVQTGINEIADATVLARRVLSRFARPFEIEEREIIVRLSMGIAFAPKDATSNDEILVKAEQAPERSKTGGGAIFSLYGATGKF